MGWEWGDTGYLNIWEDINLLDLINRIRFRLREQLAGTKEIRRAGAASLQT